MNNNQHYQNYNNQYYNNQNQMQNHYYNQQIPTNMYQPNQLGQYFQNQKRKKPIWLWLLIPLVLIVVGITVWLLFFKVDIDDFTLEEQVQIALMDKIQEVFEEGTTQEKEFAASFLNILEIIFNSEFEVDSIDDGMMEVEARILSYLAILNYEEDEELRQETMKEMNIFIEDILDYLDYNMTRIEILEDTILKNMNAVSEVEKATLNNLNQAITSYKEYLLAFKDFLKNPSNEKYQEIQELHFKAISLFDNSIVEYIQ